MDKFHYEANGYNRSEVNAFIERVIRETEGIINKWKSTYRWMYKYCIKRSSETIRKRKYRN